MARHELFEGAATYHYENLILEPGRSDVHPTEPSVRSRFSRSIGLEIPIVSAAMDTVTETRMAKAMALNGALGVLHRNMPPKDQADMVREVKRSGYIVINPTTVTGDMRVAEVYELSKDLGFGTFPVINSRNEMVGLVTKPAIHLGVIGGAEQVSEIMKDDYVSLEFGATKEDIMEVMKQEGIGKIPILKNRKLYGLAISSDLLEDSSHKAATRDKEGRLKVGAAVGVLPHDAERVEALYQAKVDVLVIDSSHGYCGAVIDTVKKIKKEYGGAVDVVAGNVATGDGAVALAQAGADGIKVGIGPGRACTTWEVTGAGKPQASAVYDSKKGLDEEGFGYLPLVADGGIEKSGDITIALAIGADSVMVGGLLSGTYEAPGKMVESESDVKYRIYRGMASKEALGSRHGYGRAVEGREVLVPYSGNVEDVLRELVNGVKSGMAHTGAKNIEDLRKKARLRPVDSRYTR